MPSRRYKRKRTSRRRSQRRSRRSQRRSRRSSRTLRRYRGDLTADSPPLSTDDDSSTSSSGSGLGIPFLKDHAEKYREMSALFDKDITNFEQNHGKALQTFHGQYKVRGVDDSFLYVEGTVTPISFRDTTINVRVSIEKFYTVRHGFFNEQFQEVVARTYGQCFILPIARIVPLDKIEFDGAFPCPLYGGIDGKVVSSVNDSFKAFGRTFVQTNVFLQS